MHAAPVPLADDSHAYLQRSDVIDWDHADVAALVRVIAADHDDETGRARAAYEWVQREVPHSHDAGRDEVTCAASDVLAQRTGICFAQSHLLAAMLRGMGVPAGFCYQVIDAEGTLHGLSAAYLDGPGWVRLDARGPAPFALDGTGLAFADDPLLDRFVHADPLPQVVTALRRHHSLADLWTDLPTTADACRPEIMAADASR